MLLQLHLSRESRGLVVHILRDIRGEFFVSHCNRQRVRRAAESLLSVRGAIVSVEFNPGRAKFWDCCGASLAGFISCRHGIGALGLGGDWLA